jgi:hypothetical protein
MIIWTAKSKKIYIHSVCPVINLYYEPLDLSTKYNMQNNEGIFNVSLSEKLLDLAGEEGLSMLLHQLCYRPCAHRMRCKMDFNFLYRITYII